LLSNWRLCVWCGHVTTTHWNPMLIIIELHESKVTKCFKFFVSFLLLNPLYHSFLNTYHIFYMVFIILPHLCRPAIKKIACIRIKIYVDKQICVFKPTKVYLILIICGFSSSQFSHWPKLICSSVTALSKSFTDRGKTVGKLRAWIYVLSWHEVRQRCLVSDPSLQHNKHPFRGVSTTGSHFALCVGDFTAHVTPEPFSAGASSSVPSTSRLLSAWWVRVLILEYVIIDPDLCVNRSISVWRKAFS
jgi:hypothetical protein